MEDANKKKVFSEEYVRKVNKNSLDYIRKAGQIRKAGRSGKTAHENSDDLLETVLIGDPLKAAAKRLEHYIPPKPIPGNTPQVRGKMKEVEKDPHKTALEYLRKLASFYKDDEQSNKKR